MKNGKRIISLCCAIIAILSVLAVSAFASNYTDEGFAFTVYTDVVKLLDWREKTDTTPIYLYIKTGTTSPIRVSALGAIESSDVMTDLTCVHGAYAAYVTCSVGVKYSVHSFVYECGYDLASLQFWNPYSTSNYITGVWSPDSVGTYTYAT